MTPFDSINARARASRATPLFVTLMLPPGLRFRNPPRRPGLPPEVRHQVALIALRRKKAIVLLGCCETEQPARQERRGCGGSAMAETLARLMQGWCQSS
jgi:hypothetical protein